MTELRDMTHDRKNPLFDGAPEAPVEQPMMVYESGVPASTAMVPVTSPVFAILERAIEHGTDPANLERLVALVERMQAKEAENKFNAAMQRFQSQCPVIKHNDSASFKNVNYTYADLPQIARTIRDLLSDCQLSYSFDSRPVAGNTNAMEVICTVHHIAGHKRSASWTLGIDSPNKDMALHHKTASTLTYARRYALVLALGLTTSDMDDDGRAAIPPEKHDNPDQTPDAPRTGTRAERSKPKGFAPQPVTKEDMGNLNAEWLSQRHTDDATPEKWAAWMEACIGRPYTRKLSDLTQADIAKCWDALGVPRPEAT